METGNEGEVVFILEVELEYPDELHHKHADILISKKETVDQLKLDYFQTETKKDLKLPAPQASKPRQTFHPKQNYVVHYHNLEFFVHRCYKNKSSCQISLIKVAFQID